MLAAIDEEKVLFVELGRAAVIAIERKGGARSLARVEPFGPVGKAEARLHELRGRIEVMAAAIHVLERQRGIEDDGGRS